MNVYELVVAMTVAALGACGYAASGYGLNILVVPLLALIDTRLVPAPLLLAGLPLGILMARRERGWLDGRGIRWALAGRVPGTVIGSLAVAALSTRSMAVLIAALILISVALSLGPWRPTPAPGTLLAAGVASGVMGTATASGAPPIAMVYQHRAGAELRATLGAYLVVAALLSLLSLAAVGELGPEELRLGGLLLPGMLGGYACSRWVVPILDRGYTRRVVLTTAAVSALVLAVQPWM
jgi:uncharacterized membrane protein YfcA